MDADEFDRYFHERYVVLVAHVAAMCGSRDEASEAVQEAFAKAWARRGTFGRHPNKDAWIRTVARNHVVDRWRRSRRLADFDFEPATPDADAAARLTLYRALRELPDNQRHAVVLYYLADEPVASIATELKASEGTVRVWLSRGRDRLATLLTDEEAHHA